MNTTPLRVLVAVTVLLGAAACGRGSSAGSPAAAPADRVLRLGFLSDPGQPPDPDIFYAGPGLILTQNTYEGLLRYKAGTPTPAIEGALATKWTASKDNKIFTFELREGVKFHDGTAFTAGAIKPSFDRRLAVNQGPAYMVAGVDSVKTEGDHKAVITLKQSNPLFLDYLASPYGPKMMSPAVLKEQAGSDHAQAYLSTHDAGTGAYTLTDARTSTHYALKAFDGYWGAKPYFTTVDFPVQTDLSAQQLMFGKGEMAAILNSLNSSATGAYLKDTSIKTYSLPTMQSIFLYINPEKGMLTTQSNRVALRQAIDADTIVKQVYSGRGTKATQGYPPHMLPEGQAVQNIPHDTTALAKVAQSLPADQKAITIGYDSSQADDQVTANLISAQLSATGLTVKVQGYPTSQIFGWVGDAKDAPELLIAGGWPDAAPPYTWAHISFDANGGLNYLHCSTDEITKLIKDGEKTGDAATFARIGELSVATGCWYNLANRDDFMVTQPWLRGIEEAHVVTTPTSLNLAALSADTRG
ncbi:MAG: transporter substrate-binding protein [Sphaerisporangium sp.]|nr:transporter substrate-binding protein [Sphaerisporangium sp.]